MLLLKVVGMLLKYVLNELAITSGSLIMMPFSLMEVLDDLRFLPRMVTLSYYFQKNSQEVYGNTVLWQCSMNTARLQIIIILQYTIYKIIIIKKGQQCTAERE